MNIMCIQNKVLPKDWIQKVESFNISSLSKNNQLIACFLINRVRIDNDESLQNDLVQLLVKHIIFKSSFPNAYDDLPLTLLKDGLSEIKENMKEFEFSRKVDSIFSEFITYKKFVEMGYKITDFKRIDGSCDLEMLKDEIRYNFEVKFKENENIHISRLSDYIKGFSLLEENEFLRGKDFEINLKVPNITNKNILDIKSEIDCFIKNKNDIFNGKLIQIFPRGKMYLITADLDARVDNYINNFSFREELKNSYYIEKLINKIFIGDKLPLSKLINKSKKYNNKNDFNGCLVWSIPFHNEIDISEIEKSFKKVVLDLNLNFDLHIFIVGIMKDNHYFKIKKG